MLQFINLDQENPPKRKTENRKDDFNEIYNEFISQKAKEQSSRCSQCGVPFCQIHCPLNNNIPDWLKLTAEGRLKEAYEVSQSTNNMPEVCGRICPQDRLCEGNCVIEQSGHGTVTIGSVEKYITDTAWKEGWVKPIEARSNKNQSVGIIGAGPAGLAAGEQLRKLGYQIIIYDRYDRSGFHQNTRPMMHSTLLQFPNRGQTASQPQYDSHHQQGHNDATVQPNRQTN